MSPPERMACQARVGHCFRVVERQTPLFGSAKFGQLSSGWFNVVNEVSRSAQIRALSKTAATCSAAHGGAGDVGDEPVRAVAGPAWAGQVISLGRRYGIKLALVGS